MKDENTNSFLIRRATPSDAGEIIEGINIICSEGGAFYTTRFLPTLQWKAVLHHPDSVLDHFLTVAEWNGKFAGAGRIFPGGRYTLMYHTAELGLFVLKPFRKQGIGGGLLNRLMDWARQESIEKITLTVFASNLPAIQLFKKNDFSQVGCLRNQLKTENRYVDLLLMERFLSAI
jgi:RimJ/RimL family protein N-acetyltransferase